MFDIKNVLFTFKTAGLNIKLNKIKAFRPIVQQSSIVGFRNRVSFKLVFIGM
jgi:hypothetical protein